jgi:ATP-dependent protease HslVU (ClpYQ) peptidase subunit
MTVIAWDGKILAADRQINVGETKYESSKIKRLSNGDIVAWCGCIDAGLILCDWYEQGTDFPFDVKDQALTDLVVVTKRQCFTYCQSPHPHKIESKFMAWGAGSDFAIGAMAMGATAREAVKIASKHCSACGMGIDWYEAK